MKEFIEGLPEDNLDYQSNHPDYGWRTDPEFERQKDLDKIFDELNNTNWEKESDYHNTVYLGKGKYNKGRTLRMKNKEYHELNGEK